MQRLQRRKCRWRLVAVALLVGGATVSAAQGGGRPAAAYQVMTAGDCTVVDAERAPDATESELLDIVNGYRQELGLPTLVPTASLMRAARWKAAALAAAPPVLLTGRDLDDADRTWQRRLRDCGYPAIFSVGELLGQIPGGADAAAVFQFWLEQEANVRLLQNPGWRAAGVAYAEVNGFTFWVLDLGAEPQ